ncbi:hypothetical protein BSL78_29100 [Apostichopus japonicus]|uniref:Uncharacterized protein n=1 Tax=Stichopus japonicus TaxID=307972 RepID=A0A2G8JEA4_STIJA|nr:hypothetical protein BSL78_29100 [Apostichopus japonicus]
MGGDSQSDSEDMEEIEENNLNLEDILLTMKFLEGRRKRLLAVLSSDEGVNAVDDLDETETLIRHFEERKTKISQRKPKEPTRSSQLQSEQPGNIPEAVSSNEEVFSSLKAEDEEVTEVDNRYGHEESDLDIEDQTTKSRDIDEHVDNVGEASTTKVEHDEHEFPILESQETEQSIPEKLPSKPVVDPATLKDLGQMLRSSLKISAEPFRSKQTAAISPFRRPVAHLPTSPSAFLDNRDTMQNVNTGQQGNYQTDSVMEQQIGINETYDQMLPVSEQSLYQHQIHGYQGQYVSPPFAEGHEYYIGMGRGVPLPQTNPQLNNPGYSNTVLREPQLYGETLHNNPMNPPDIPRMEPTKMDPGGLKNPHIGYSMPGGGPPRLIMGGPRFDGSGRNGIPGMGSQIVRHQGVQQFYSGGLEMRHPKPMQPPMRNPAPPMIRGMRVPGPPSVIRFQNPGAQALPAFHLSGPSNFNSMAGGMPFPPTGVDNMPNQSQHGLGGMNNMYGAPPPFNVGNRMYATGAMGRGMGRGAL